MGVRDQGRDHRAGQPRDHHLRHHPGQQMTMETLPGSLEPAELPRGYSGREAPTNRSPFIETLIVLLSWRRVILAFTVGVLLVTLIYSIVASPVYVART